VDFLDAQGAAGAGFAPDEGLEEALREHDLRTEAEEVARTRVTAGVGNVGSLALIGGSFLVATVVLLVARPPGRFDLDVLLSAVLLYGIAFRIEFKLGPGSAVPTSLALVPMLLLLPVQLVPLAALGGVLAGSSIGSVMPFGRRFFVNATSLFHVLGPVLVLLWLAPGAPSLRHWPVYLFAFAAQVAFDLFSIVGRQVIGLGFPLKGLLLSAAWTFAVDATLAPIALMGVLALPRGWPGVAFGAAPLGLVVLMARDRGAHLKRAIELGEGYRQAADRARLDPLTGLGNRLAWVEAVEDAAAHAHGAGVVLLDLDGLKQANDTHGHRFGDGLIVEIARLLARHAAGADVVARLGGDEFAALYIDASAARCEVVAEQVREAVARHPGVDGFRLSAAVGSASWPPAESLAASLEEADRRVYAEKRRRPGSRSDAA